jgi:hypothetical protein
VIAWLDRLQSSVRSAPAHSGSATNPFQLDTRVGKGGGQSDESDEEHASQRPVQARPASSGSGDTPLSPNTLVESDVDPYPDDAVPIGLLASLAISTSKDATGVAAEKTRKENATADEDDVVRVYSSCLRRSSHAKKAWLMGRFLEQRWYLFIGCRQQDVLHARPSDEPRLAQIINRQDEATRYFGA